MKNIFPFLFLHALSITTNAQDAKKIFSEEKIVFYGLDFTKAKFALPDVSIDEIKNTLFSQWNENVFTDNGRFGKESAFQKVTVPADPTIVDRRNKDVSTAGMTDKYETPLSKEDIQKVIEDYKNGKRKEGVGVVFVVESFSKKDKKGIADVVFFDIVSRKVLLTKRMTGEPRGGGLNSYWAGAIEVMFNKMINGEFDAWKKEAGVK